MDEVGGGISKDAPGKCKPLMAVPPRPFDDEEEVLLRDEGKAADDELLFDLDDEGYDPLDEEPWWWCEDLLEEDEEYSEVEGLEEIWMEEDLCRLLDEEWEWW